MRTGDYLRVLKEEIHSAVFATVDDTGRPVTRVIDIMLADEDSLYFITARGKEFYRQLKKEKFVAVSGMTQGKDSLERKAVSVRGEAEELGDGLLDRVFTENPYMEKIYPERQSRSALSVFRLCRGEGEYFDLSTTPITRHRFYLGEEALKNDGKKECGGYFITDGCNGCSACLSVCPQKCIEKGEGAGAPAFQIRQEHCLHCGNCLEACRYGAVERRWGDGSSGAGAEACGRRGGL